MNREAVLNYAIHLFTKKVIFKLSEAYMFLISQEIKYLFKNKRKPKPQVDSINNNYNREAHWAQTHDKVST